LEVNVENAWLATTEGLEPRCECWVRLSRIESFMCLEIFPVCDIQVSRPMYCKLA
jgi:hypothetical protein